MSEDSVIYDLFTFIFKKLYKLFWLLRNDWRTERQKVMANSSNKMVALKVISVVHKVR
jgi:ABC-type transport system involved in Fe-S cluster assembly fused permease/ATPase subunit